MKTMSTLIAVVSALAFMASTGSTQAQVTNLITLTISALAQSNTNDDGTFTTAPAPSKHTIATKDILSLLAMAKHAENNAYPSTNFPAGAKLVVVTGDNPAFQVLTSTNTLLADVSDIINSDDGKFGNYVYSGKQNDTNNLASPITTNLHILTIKYDDTWINGSVGVKFYMIGLMTSTTTDTVPTAGVYTQTESHKLASGTGEGIYQGQQFVLTGTMSASGKATLTLVP